MKTGPKGPSIWTETRIEEEVEPLLEYALESSRPLLEEIATKRGYNTSLVTRDFVKRSIKFSNALSEFRNIQKTKWIDVALTTKNQAAAIFMLKNLTDMRDEQIIRGEGFNQIFNIIVPSDVKLREGNRLGHNVQIPTA